MISVVNRIFTDSAAVRARVPLLVGLVGPSGSGKTYSGLRLATGIQRVTGGDIGVIDTEARRALHYADEFKFRHLPFEAPFGPLDYLAAIEHFHAKGVRTVMVDSASHEHEGPGGVLEMHEAEAVRLAEQWRTSLDAVKMSAWQKPKSERRRLINTILQMPINFIFCFRAKEKLKIAPGQKPKPLGWMPIAGEEFVFEMTVNCLLYPNSGGVPKWHPDELGEKAMIKLPSQFKSLFAQQQPLSEAIGEQLALWAEGGAAPVVPAADEKRALLADVQAVLMRAYPGSDAAAKKAKGEAIGWAFRVSGWKAVEGLDVAPLRAGLDSLQRMIEGTPGPIPFDDDDEAAREAEEERAALQVG